MTPYTGHDAGHDAGSEIASWLMDSVYYSNNMGEMSFSGASIVLSIKLAKFLDTAANH